MTDVRPLAAPRSARRASGPVRAGLRSREDVEGLRRRVAQLERAVEARDDIIATIGHELRNPLTPLLLRSQHLLLQIDEDHPESVPTLWLVSRLGAFTRHLGRFAEVLRQLVEASRGGMDAVPLSPVEVDITDAVRDACAGMEDALAWSGCKLRLRAREPVRGLWDPVRLEQIVGNLLGNAVRYGAGRPIDVTVSAAGDLARLTIRDRGPGVAPADRERIFEKFERGGASPCRGGLGLGLWVVRRLCTAMGGRVELLTRPGRGATFLVELPRRGGGGR